MHAFPLHLRSVSAEQPIFDDTEPMAAHCDSCAPWWSRTNRTARSRSSGEYLFECFIAPVSQGLEPPGNPGQFSPAATATVRVAVGVARARRHMLADRGVELCDEGPHRVDQRDIN